MHEHLEVNNLTYIKLMKQKLRNLFQLRAVMLVALMCAAFTGAWGQASVNTVLWSEDWTGSAANTTPSTYEFTGTSVYDNATLTYAQSSVNTKLYNETLAGGTAPELLLSKSNQTWTISDIPTGQATEMSLTFKSNKSSFSLTSTTEGITIDGSGTQWTITVEGTATAFNLTLKNTSSSNARIDDIQLVVITAGTGGDTPTPTSEDCDLALTGAPIALNFDLYNNHTAQTISYTTSSTGEVSVESGAYDVSCYIDEENKTITVTPMAVTNGAQTVTVNQAADDTYAAGSVTFTVTVTDSTPIATHNATFSVNGTTSTEEFEEGAVITFPADPADIEGKKFVGWVTEAISGVTDEAPTFVTSATMGESDVTYYAVFADVTGEEVAQSLTIDAEEHSAGFPTSYAASANYTLSGKSFNITQAYDAGTRLQWRAAGNNNGTGTMYNTEAISNIQSVVLVYDAGDSNKNFTLNVGSSANPTTGTSITPTINGSTYTYDCSAGNYSYFVLTNGEYAGYLTSITINYKEGSTSVSGYCTTVVADTRTDSELAFSASEANAEVGQDFTAPTLNTATGFNGTVEYTSSNEEVAFVADSETGELNILAEGTTTITATFAGNDYFKAGSASYTLTVTDSRIATTISQDNITIDINEVATLTQLTPVVKDAEENVVEYTNSPTAEGLPEVYFELVGEDTDGLIGSFDSHGNIVLNSAVGTVTIKAVYNQFQSNANYKPSECTFTITIEDPNAPGTENNPYTVAQALAAEAGESAYVTGTISEITEVNLTYYNATYKISDGENEMIVYRGKYLDNSNFTATDQIQIGDIVVIYGNLTQFNSVNQLAQNNYLVSLDRPVVTTPTITTSSSSLTGFTYVEGNGPSAAQQITIGGINQTTDGCHASLDANSSFEFSFTENDQDFFSDSGIGTDANQSSLIYVRMKSGLAVGDYEGSITITSQGAETVTVNLSGSVTAPEAPNVTWDLSTDQTATATENEMTWTSSYATMAVEKADASTNTNNYYPGTPNQSYTSTRFYFINLFYMLCYVFHKSILWKVHH